MTPNMALIPGLKEAGYDIHYVGSYNGIERRLIEDMGILITESLPASSAAILILRISPILSGC